MSFFISDAVAATGAPAQGSPMSLILMLVVFGLIFYFMILNKACRFAPDQLSAPFVASPLACVMADERLNTAVQSTGVKPCYLPVEAAVPYLILQRHGWQRAPPVADLSYAVTFFRSR